MLVYLSIAAFFLLYVLWFRLFYMFLWHPLCPFHNTHHSLIALFILQLLLFNLCFQKDATPWKQGLCLSYLLLLPSMRQMARLEEALMTIEWASISSLSPSPLMQGKSQPPTLIFSLSGGFLLPANTGAIRMNQPHWGKPNSIHTKHIFLCLQIYVMGLVSHLYVWLWENIQERWEKTEGSKGRGFFFRCSFTSLQRSKVNFEWKECRQRSVGLIELITLASRPRCSILSQCHLPPPLSTCVTTGIPLISEPWFSHLQNGNDYSSPLISLLRGFNEGTRV